MDVVELAPHMRPAGDLGHGRGLPVRGLIERPETGIAVSLQEAVERGQVRARMLAPAIGRVAIDDRRWPLAPVGPFTPQIRPTAGRSWSCRCPAPEPAPACRPRAASRPS